MFVRERLNEREHEPRHGRSHRAWRGSPSLRRAAAACASVAALALAGCSSSFFALSPTTENGATVKPAAKPATRPPADTAKPGAAKPGADKPAPAKPAATPASKPTTEPKTAAPPAATPAAKTPDRDSIRAAQAARDSVKAVADREARALRDSTKAENDRKARAARDSVAAARKAADASAAAARAANAQAATAPATAPASATVTGARPALPTPPLARRPEPIIDPPAVEPEAKGSDSLGVAHLVKAAALWDAVRMFHPAAAVGRVAWDNATVRRLTGVRTARTAEQYATVMREWVATLGDVTTRVERASDARAVDDGVNSNLVLPSGTVSITVAPFAPPLARGKKPTPANDSVIVLTWPRNVATNDSAGWASLRATAPRLRNALRVVLDLRGAPASRAAGAGFDTRTAFARNAALDLANTLASGPALGPSVRTRIYESATTGVADAMLGGRAPVFDAAQAPSTHEVTGGWRVSDPLATVTANGALWSGLRHIVLVGDSTSALAPALLALVNAGQATLIAEGALSDASLTPTRTVDIGDGLAVRLRTGELLNADGSVGIVADSTVPVAAAGDSTPALKLALQVAHGVVAPRAARFAPHAADTGLINSAWNTGYYPIMGARLLGAFETWSALRTMHAYGELRDEELGETFARVIPRVEAARDADTFAAAMLDLSTAMDDAQGGVTGPSVAQHIGAASAPFRVRYIDGRAVVTQVLPEAANIGVAIGDEIAAADGYPMAAYIAEHRRAGPASNDWTRLRNIMDMVPRGAAGEASFRVRDTNGRERQINAQRTAAFASALPATERASTSPVRELAGGIGYIDLDRMSTRALDSAFIALRATRGLVLDVRSTRAIDERVLALALRNLSQQARSVAYRETMRIVTEPCDASARNTCDADRRQSDKAFSADTSRRYRGRTVLLVDERTQGALEAFALALEGASNVTIVGSPSAGASGAIATVSLPGQLTLAFSGTDVRHADGRQLQRVGITPQVDARPTMKGVRAGLDEPLDAAQKYLVQLLDPPVKKRK